MEALGEWLKQIIVVVLLATFIDLLLPNKTMQRYVKLVVSLFILMTILSPVLQLFGSNANLRMLAAAVDGWTVAGLPEAYTAGQGGAAGQGASIPALSEVLSDAQLLERQRNERALDLLAKQLESMVVEHVETQHGVKQADAEAALALDDDGMPLIRSITVRIWEHGNAESADSDTGKIAEIKPMEPVRIEPVTVEPIRIGEPAVEASAESADEELMPVNGNAKEIALSVARAWNIPASRVKVEFVK